MKKFKELSGNEKISGVKKLFRIMKLSVFLILISITGVFANKAWSQSKILNLNMKKATVREVLSKIEDQSGFHFMYSGKIIDVNKLVSINVQDAGIDEVLRSLFAGTDVGYTVKGRLVILTTPEHDDGITVQQQGQVSGRVTDSSGSPLPGVTVVIKGTTQGIITNHKGNYSLAEVPANAILVFSFVGMRSQEINVAGENNISVIMEEETIGIEEVVAIGYGVQKKENLTGAVSQIKMEEILGNRPVVNIATALQGTIPGLYISGNHQVGQSKSLQIRDAYSIGSGSTISPLVLIDNVEGNIDMVNPEDVESISVLKDSSSSAIYGARAAGGVIIISTKRPKSGAKFQFNYNNNFGLASVINLPQQAHLDDYFQAYLDAGFGDTYWGYNQNIAKWRQYLKDYKANPSAFDIVGDGIYKDTDGVVYYLNEHDNYKAMMETGLTQNHNVSVSGGTDKLCFRISGGYNKQDGTLITSKDKYERLNISAYISADITPWFTQEVDIKYARSKKELPGNAAENLWNVRLISYYPQGVIPAHVYGLSEDLPVNTSINTILYGNTSVTNMANPRIFAKSIVKPSENLDVVFEYTYDLRDVRYDYYSGNYKVTDIQQGEKNILNSDYYIKRHNFTDYNAFNVYSTFSRLWGNHNFKAMAGFNQESSYYEYVNIQVNDQAILTVPSLDGATGNVQLKDNYIEYAIRGGFFRLNYNYVNKYFIEVNGRYDGSSKFTKDSRFGFFPSASAGWHVARESFMEMSKNWLSEFKIRASFGKIGNQNIDAYQYSPSMELSTWTASMENWLNNGEQVTTIGMPSLVSGDFTWEEISTLNIGTDISLFGMRLRSSFDWYNRNTTGMLAPGTQLPAVVGADAPLQNTADMRTRGWEFACEWRDKLGKISYHLGLNFTDYKSSIVKYNNASGLISDYYKGQTIGEIWGYLTDGYYTVDDFKNTNSWEIKEDVTSINGYTSLLRPGDLKFRNISDADGTENVITAGLGTVEDPGDRTVIGNSKPRYQFGANLGISYKGLDFSMLLQGVGKRDYWLSKAAIFPFHGSAEIFVPVFYNQVDYWTPVDPENGDYTPLNPDATLPRIYELNSTTAVESNTRTSDKYLANAAYMRIKNITLSYNFPAKWTKKIEINTLKLFASIENLATFSSLPKGYDPETLSWTYPCYRTISFGCNISF